MNYENCCLGILVDRFEFKDTNHIITTWSKSGQVPGCLHSTSKSVQTLPCFQSCNFLKGFYITCIKQPSRVHFLSNIASLICYEMCSLGFTNKDKRIPSLTRADHSCPCARFQSTIFLAAWYLAQNLGANYGSTSHITGICYLYVPW